MTADQPVSDGAMPCPVPHPDGIPDSSCSKKIPRGWTADEGHPGGHWWIGEQTVEFLRTGHYDNRALLAGEPFGPHDPADCHPYCPRFWDEANRRLGTAPVTTPEGTR